MYERHHDAVAPFLTLAAGLAVAGVALVRHFAQTDADRQRRITESFSKAVEQLAHDKIEVRLGGIYTLERISRESPNDYWTVMETLCAFVRERAPRKSSPADPAAPLLPAVASSETVDRYFQKGETGPPTDIAAVLAVIRRRDQKSQQRESDNGWRLDFSGADLRKAKLRQANLNGADLNGADLSGANLFGADLIRARLFYADLSGADLFGANLRWAHLYGASLFKADLSTADLREADLRKAKLRQANLNGAELSKANLGGADLIEAEGVLEILLLEAFGDASTQFPVDLPRPAHWPAAEP